VNGSNDVVKKKQAGTKQASKEVPKQMPKPSSKAPTQRKVLSPAARVRNTVFKGGMVHGLQIHVKTLSKKKVTAEMRVKDIHLNYNGRVNGGALMAFGDIIGAAGASMNRPPHYRGGTLESKTNFFAAGMPPVINAVSIPLHIGRTTSVWQTTLSNTDGRVVAIVTQTQIVLPPAPTDTPSGD
jgi:1,4-dihydroxy-2-naphthoyl-CoA hydrolase